VHDGSHLGQVAIVPQFVRPMNVGKRSVEVADGRGVPGCADRPLALALDR
jgi:hypothetical protein